MTQIFHKTNTIFSLFFPVGTFIWASLVLVFFYPLFFKCEVSATSTQLMSNPTQDVSNVCDIVYCGRGTCHPSSTDSLGFTCDCESGWKKPNLGPLQLPPCSLPNCTVDLRCGNGSLPFPTSLPTKVSDPCLWNFCGDGTCVRDGFSFRCECNEDSANLLNDPRLLCIRKCTLKGNCYGLNLWFNLTPIPIPPPPPIFGSGSSGSGETLRFMKKLRRVTMLILTLIFEIWI